MNKTAEKRIKMNSYLFLQVPQLDKHNAKRLLKIIMTSKYMFNMDTFVIVYNIHFLKSF